MSQKNLRADLLLRKQWLYLIQEEEGVIHKLIDRFLKDVIERHAEEIISAIFSQSAFRALSTQLDKEIIVRSREVDKAVMIRTKHGKHIIHFESYKRYSRQHLRDTFSYAGALTAKYKLDVTTIWLLIKPPSKRVKDIGLYQAMPFGAPTNQFSFVVVKLWELLDAILAGEPLLMPLVPLLPELVVKPDLMLPHRQRDLIQREKNPKRHAELLFYTIAFNKRHFPARVIDDLFSNLLLENRKMIKEFKAVIETPVLKEIFEEWAEQKAEELAEKERTLALQEALLDVLAIRFGKENGKVRRMVLAVNNPKKLKVIHRRALKAKSLDPIIALLQKA
jgi:hypothetical protein